MDSDKVLDLSDKYTTRTHAFIKKYENQVFKNKIFNKPITPGKKLTEKIVSLHESALTIAKKVSYKISAVYTDNVTSEQAFNLARWTTVPYNWLWFIFLKHQGKKILPIFENGTHFGYALQGGGKSSLAYNIMEHLRILTGLGSYVNVELEKPRYDPIKQNWYKLHQLFSETDYWGLKEQTDNLGNTYYESTQLKGFDIKKFRNVIIDELFSLFNQRENKKSSYNNVFIGLMKSIVHQRHAEIDRYYFFSQIEKTDVQLESIFKWVHQIKVVLDCTYWEWVKSGKLTKHIIGWWIVSSTKERNKRGIEKIIAKKYFLPRIYDEQYFETKNMKHLYDHLPIDRVQVTRGAINT